MLGLQIVVAVGAAVLLGGALARRLHLSEPLALVAVGLLLTLVPALRGVGLPPETVLLLFLPALLYWESLTTSMREIRRFLRGILLSGTLLVAFTAAVVAVVAHQLGLSWSTAWILGAAVAPTDATAVAALGRVLPRGSLTTLRAESLINDGTALVIYALALAYATTGQVPGPWAVTWSLALSFGGGTLVAVVVGWVVLQIRKRVGDPVHHNVLMVLTPFVAYLIAEEIHASGVVAVVAVGLFMSQVAPRFVSARVRAQSTPFWTITTFLLNGALFVLVGMQLPRAVRGLHSAALVTGLVVALVVYASVVLARWVFLNVSIMIIRAIDRRPYQRTLRTTPRQRIVNTAAGFRGAVSLAVALSVPESFTGGAYPARDMIVFVTAVVVVCSLALQGLALPRLIAWARIPEDTALERETQLALRTATQEALDALPRLAREGGVDDEVAADLREEYEDRLGQYATDDGGEGEDDAEAGRLQRQYVDLRLAVFGVKRATVVRLRDERVIDDTVLRRIQARLDLEELRLRSMRDAS